MTDYSDFSAEDFSKDEYFKSWVINPEEHHEQFWETWIKNHPEKNSDILKAKALILAFDELFNDDLTQKMIEEEINLLKLKAGFSNSKSKYQFPYYNVFRWVAAVVMTSGIGYLTFLNQKNTPQLTAVATHSNDTHHAEWITKTNDREHPQTIILNDGSEVILGKNSSIRYLTDYTQSPERSVYLNGEAFFDISRDTLHPFLVFAGSTVTRVLGTSFRVQASDKLVEVSVATGKVAVHRLNDYQRHSGENQQDIPGVILSPYDKIVFEPVQESFKTSRLKPNESIVIPRTDYETEFSDIPVTQVLDCLKRTYAIEIQYDSLNLQNCYINTMFKDETLTQKLRLICLAIGADFKVSNDQILIGPAKCN